MPPLRPDDLKNTLNADLLEKAQEVINRLIPKAWDGTKTTVRTAEIVRQLGFKVRQAESLFLAHWREIINSYGDAGWEVERSGEGEPPPAFVFTQP